MGGPRWQRRAAASMGSAAEAEMRAMRRTLSGGVRRARGSANAARTGWALSCEPSSALGWRGQRRERAIRMPSAPSCCAAPAAPPISTAGSTGRAKAAQLAPAQESGAGSGAVLFSTPGSGPESPVGRGTNISAAAMITSQLPARLRLSMREILTDQSPAKRWFCLKINRSILPPVQEKTRGGACLAPRNRTVVMSKDGTVSQ